MSDSYGPFIPQWRAGSVGYGPLTVTLPCVTDDGWISALVSARYGQTYIPMHLHVAPVHPGVRPQPRPVRWAGTCMDCGWRFDAGDDRRDCECYTRRQA